jgi:ribonuclease-3
MQTRSFWPRCKNAPAPSNWLNKAPAAPKKTRQRTTQLKLAGIATIQPDAPLTETKKPARAARMSAARETEETPATEAKAEDVVNQSKSA